VVDVSDDFDRRAAERARYLDRTTDLDRDHARAVALAERGYSDHGIASVLDVTPGTVTGWLDDVAARYGAEAVYPKVADDRGDLEAVGEDEVMA
jgi:hypothetical protein